LKKNNNFIIRLRDAANILFKKDYPLIETNQKDDISPDTYYSERLNNLRALYNHANDETKHYRIYEWQISVWTVALNGALISILYYPQPQAIETYFKYTILTTIVFVFGCFIFNILHCHISLNKNRTVIRDIEQNYFDFGIEKSCSYRFPDKFIKEPSFIRGWFHLVIWITAVFLSSAYAILTLLSKYSIFGFSKLGQ
jgi:hypothetical protein